MIEIERLNGIFQSLFFIMDSIIVIKLNAIIDNLLNFIFILFFTSHYPFPFPLLENR